MRQFCIALTIIYSTFSISAQSFDVDTILYNGDINSNINIVVLGDGYLESELDQFSIDAQNIADATLKDSPFSNYKNYFNVFSVKVPSNESGASLDPDNLIDNYYGSTFGYAGIERLLVPTNYAKITNVLANNFPSYDLVLMVVNSSKYGGSGGWVATSSTHSSANEIALHEVGHAFSALADEYWAGAQYAHEAINMTQQTNIDELKWTNWYNDFGIGLFPHSESPTWFRPHQSCKMRYLGWPFCAVCIEGIVERIHALVSPIESFEPNSTIIKAPSFPLLLKLELINPIPNTLKRTWEINSSPFKNNVDSILLNESNLIEGENIISVTVEDTTGLLRIDNHSTIHLSNVSWSIELTHTGIENITSSSNELIVNLFPNPSEEFLNIKIIGDIRGKLKVDIVDLQGRKQASYNLDPTGVNSLPIENLHGGIYTAIFYIDNKLITSRKIIKTE